MHALVPRLPAARAAAYGLSCLAALLIAGCGAGGTSKVPVQPASGTLYLDDETYGPAMVTLLPGGQGEGMSATGVVDENGQITFTTYSVGDGAPAGNYKVLVAPSTTAAAPKPFPAVYMRMDDTRLTATVEAGQENVLEIRMDSSAGPPAPTPGGVPGVPGGLLIDPAAVAPPQN